MLGWFCCAPVTSRVSPRRASYFFLLRQKKVTKKKASHVRAASRSLALLAAFGTLANSLRSNSASVLIRTLLRCSARPNGGGYLTARPLRELRPRGSSASRTSPERLVRFANFAREARPLRELRPRGSSASRTSPERLVRFANFAREARPLRELRPRGSSASRTSPERLVRFANFAREARPLRELRPRGSSASRTSPERLVRFANFAREARSLRSPRGVGLPHSSRITSHKGTARRATTTDPSFLIPPRHSGSKRRTQTSSFRAQSRNPCFPALQLGCCDYAQHDGMCRAPLPPSPTPFPVFPHPSPLRPHPSLLTPHSSLLTPHPSLLTPHSSLLTPHSSLLTPHSSLLIPLSQCGGGHICLARICVIRALL